ncbi:hypothetical protein [Pedobacter sp.]|uniref:hypothetical protein n=1 Tax=Pedobacter sp. TaxID=1411316 RepID=UPI003BAD6EE4
MKIDENYPIFASFVKNELDTLEYIKTRALLTKYENLSSSLDLAFYDLKQRLKSSNSPDFIFHCDFNMKVEKHNHRIIIGANVVYDYAMCSYFLAVVGKGDDEGKLIRKFHFDFALPTIATRQRVPVFHLQYGGELSPKVEESGLSGERLDSWLSVPRLNYTPINLALLLDILFCEFKTQETYDMIQGDLWRAMIFNNEKFLTVNYFKNIYEHIGSTRYKKENLLRDLCYGDLSG